MEATVLLSVFMWLREARPVQSEALRMDNLGPTQVPLEKKEKPGHVSQRLVSQSPSPQTHTSTTVPFQSVDDMCTCHI